MNDDLREKVSAAIRRFWTTRDSQQTSQGGKSRTKDYGSRGAVTGGKHLDGFISLINDLLLKAGLSQHTIFAHSKKSVILPGFFRPTKQWDLLVVADGDLLATIEFKSQVGPSFGNNYNNRTEEAIGSATDFWTAYREGAFRNSVRPWLGYFILLEHAPASSSPVKVDEPHFAVFPEFEGASYAKRYEQLCVKLVRERLYDSVCLLLSDRKGGKQGDFREPLGEISFTSFAASLMGKVEAHTKVQQMRGKGPEARTED